MSKQALVELEPHPRRSLDRDLSDNQLKKAELSAIMASETLVLATALGQVILSGLERRERQKERRIMLLIAFGLAALVGMARLAIQLVTMS